MSFPTATTPPCSAIPIPRRRRPSWPRAQAVMEGAACQESMANNYAMIAMLVLEKDLARTVAQMVRFNCKTYPSPTPLYHFMRSPYNYTKPQLEQALRVLKRGEDTQDIKTVVSFNDVLYM